MGGEAGLPVTLQDSQNVINLVKSMCALWDSPCQPFPGSPRYPGVSMWSL